MATSKGQRIGIWIIAIVMTVGTIGSFFIIVIANDNQRADQNAAQEQYAKQMEALKKMQEEAKKTYKPLDGYKTTKFDKDDIKELKIETLKQGKGETLTADSTITANYFGWGSDGEIFDTTNKNGVVTPIDFSLKGVISGWAEGLTGVKVGSTVRLSIPAEKAYGGTDDGSGRPFGPLMFVVEVVALKK